VQACVSNRSCVCRVKMFRSLSRQEDGWYGSSTASYGLEGVTVFIPRRKGSKGLTTHHRHTAKADRLHHRQILSANLNSFTGKGSLIQCSQCDISPAPKRVAHTQALHRHKRMLASTLQTRRHFPHTTDTQIHQVRPACAPPALYLAVRTCNKQ